MADANVRRSGRGAQELPIERRAEEHALGYAPGVEMPPYQPTQADAQAFEALHGRSEKDPMRVDGGLTW